MPGGEVPCKSITGNIHEALKQPVAWRIDEEPFCHLYRGQ